jgi:mRNA interferase MazF
MGRHTAVVRGDVWWASVPGGDRPVLVLTRDPVADRIGAVVVAPFTRTIRGIQSELRLGRRDGMPAECVASFDNLHTVRREALRERITQLSAARMQDACKALERALGCV